MRHLLAATPSFNWFLIIICAVVGVLTLFLALYLLIIFQHPDDRNQAWLPKLVVVLGISVSIWTVLLFPLDVANYQACKEGMTLANCDHLTLPMAALWYACYIAIIVLAFVLIPLAMFYYEADSDWGVGKRFSSALCWALLCFVFVAIAITVPYVWAGFVRYNAQLGVTGMIPVMRLDPWVCEAIQQPIQHIIYTKMQLNETLVQDGYLCQAGLGETVKLKLRVTYLMYCMAIVSTLGWLLFMVFGAIGLVALPVDLIREFLARPKKTIPRSQYLQRAKDLARRGKEIKGMADSLKAQQREGSAGRRWRRHVAKLDKQLLALEDDVARLDAVYPQGEDPAYMWIITTLMYWIKLPLGIISACLTITWVLQITLFVLPKSRKRLFLNTAFTEASNVFPLLGALLFGIWVFYLQAAVIKGALKFGLNLLVIKVYPMKHGRTMMSSFLFNVALILLATTASIQFSTQCFARYAQGTKIYQIFGFQLTNLDGIKYLYIKWIFIYIFLAVMLLTLLFLCMRGAKRLASYKKTRAYY